MRKIAINIDSSCPIWIEADPDSFGQIFAGVSDEDQVNVLRSMVEHMKPHQMQWDYIAIALEKDENRDVRDKLSVILPDIAAKDAEIERLRAALKPFAFQPSGLNFDRFDEGNTAWVAVDGAGSDRVFFFVGDVLRARAALKLEGREDE